MLLKKVINKGFSKFVGGNIRWVGHSKARESVVGLRYCLMTFLAFGWVEVSGLLVHSEGVSLLLLFGCVCLFGWLWFSWSGS